MSSAVVPRPSSSRLGSFPLWESLAVLFCALFGIFLVLIIHPDGDGGWFWYSVLFRSGQRLYRDLHLALQPMLVLEMSSVQRMLGTKWFPSLAVGTINLVLHVTALMWVVRFCTWRQWQKALLLVCSFVTAIEFLIIRFDDYHVISLFLELYSAALLLLLSRKEEQRFWFWIAAGLGILSGLCITNRLNDGAALLGAVLFVLLWLPCAGGLKTASVTALSAGVTTVGIIALTGDSLSDWLLYSIQRAAALKGGTGHVLLYPLRLPWSTVTMLLENWRITVATVIPLLIAGVVAALVGRSRDADSPGMWTALRSRQGVVLAFLVLAALPLVYRGGAAARGMVGVGVLVLLFQVGWVLWRLCLRQIGREPADWNPRELLLLLPMGQLVSSAMSAARFHPNSFPAIAAFLLLLPVALQRHMSGTRRKAFFLTLVAVLAISGFVDKMRTPFRWWNYHTASWTAKRVWYASPANGPMLVQQDELQLVEPVCHAVATNTPGSQELLSLPFPYANYFCGVPPWHGYVQTFFDTSSKATIDGLTAELERKPPQWIFYQRQLRVLREHEVGFQAGKPLPHRALDALIMSRLQTGLWHATEEKAPDADDSQWLLIRTR